MAENHVELFLVKPSIGQPIILLDDMLEEGFVLTFAAKSRSVPGERELLTWVRNDAIHLKQDGQSICALRAAEVVATREIPLPRQERPASAADYQYQAGFRWEFEVKVEMATRYLDPRSWPQMFDLWFSQRYWHPLLRQWLPKQTINHNSIYVDPSLSRDLDNFTLFHVTDLHVAGRNDRIPDVLSATRDKFEARRLLLRYRNFNDNLRAVIRRANEMTRHKGLVVLVATGDLIDHYQDGFFREGSFDSSNFSTLIRILTGKDGKGESLRLPIYLLPGNHDFLKYEQPLSYDITLGGIIPIIGGLVPVKARDTWSGFGLTLNEGWEYDYWNQRCFESGNYGCGAAEREKIKTATPESNVVEDDRYSVNLNSDQAFSIGKPSFVPLYGFVERVNYEVDFIIRIGPHQLVCLNSGEDIYPDSKHGFTKSIEDTPRSIRDYRNGGPRNRGVTAAHLEMISQALSARPSNGLVLCFTHAPALSFQNDRTEGSEVLFEDAHEQASPPPNDVTRWYAQNPYWSSRPLEEVADAFRRAGYPQHGTRHFLRRDERGVHDRYSSMHENVQKLFRAIDPGRGPVGQFNAVFSGHTHKVHEFRIRRESPDSNFFFYHLDDYSGSSRRTPSSFPLYGSSAADRRRWLYDHQPLLITSGGLKKKLPEIREIIIQADRIEDLRMRRLPRLGHGPTDGIEHLFCAASVALARLAGPHSGFDVPARNDTNPCVHAQWGRHMGDRTHLMWDLMEKYWELFIRFDEPSHREILAGLYTEISLWWNRLGVDFGFPARNAMAPEGHHDWARHAPMNQIQSETEHRVETVFALCDKTADGAGDPYRIWYAQESIFLAAHVEFADSDRGDPDPSRHLEWALSVAGERVWEEIRDKYRIALDQIRSQGGDSAATEFYVKSSSRLAAWGGRCFGNREPEPADEEFFRQRATGLSTHQLSQDLMDRLREVI